MAGLVALEKMVMLVLLMVVGFAAAKAKWVDGAFSQRASHLVANVFIVATILSSVVGAEPQMAGSELAMVVVSVFILFGIGGLIGWLAAKALPLSKQDRTVAWLSVFFMNNVFIGFPVVEALFGQSAVFCASLSNLPFNLLLFSIGVSRLGAGLGRGRVTFREVLSPAMIGTLLAIAIFLFQISLPELVGDTIQTLSGATVPLSMIIVGISLSQVPMAQALRDWKAYLVSLVRLILCPIVVRLVLGLFLTGTPLGVLTVIACCPSGAMITILCLRYGLDDTFASRVNFLSTILCAVTLPVMTSLLL